MITVKLYGPLRIDSGIKALQLEADNVKKMLDDLSMQGFSKKDLRGCIILVNGKPANKRSPLHSGDVVQLLSPVAGG